MIKLSFLQQAIDLAVDNGVVVKKKRIDAPIALRTKSIKPLSPSTSGGGVAPSTSVDAKLYVDKTLSVPPVKVPVAKPAPVSPNASKKSLLDVLKERAGERYAIQEVKEAEPLTKERLMQFWDQFGESLLAQQKHSAAGTFKIAALEIDNDIHFTVTVSAITAQKFIEQEKMTLLDQLHTEFNNRSIGFTVLVAATEQTDVPMHLRLNSKQKFERIAEQYPLVKELKDKLRLEIDY